MKIHERIVVGGLLIFSLSTACKKEAASVSDIDGNVYNTVTLGSQVWMKENLKTTRYSNGDEIPTTNPASLSVEAQPEPKYQWPAAGDEGYAATFGRLYTWYVVKDPRNVCPSEWHVPSDAEWKELTDYLEQNSFGFGGSGSDIAKSLASASEWDASSAEGSPGTDLNSNNRSGFSALPAGYRYSSGSFIYMGEIADWWSSTEVSLDQASDKSLVFFRQGMVAGNSPKKIGYSVRCVRN